MPTYGTDTRTYVPTAFSFAYDGITQGWGTLNLMSINDVSNQAGPVNNKLSISDLSVSFADTNGSIWTALGNGTTAFNKDFSGTVFIGGSMGNVSSPLGNRFQKVSESGAWSVPFHTGKIREVGKTGNVVSIRSENLMNFISQLKWKFPLANSTDYQYFVGSHFGKFSFAVDNLSATWQNLLDNAAYKKESNNTEADVYFFASNDDFAGFSESPGIYDTSQGTGIIDTIPLIVDT